LPHGGSADAMLARKLGLGGQARTRDERTAFDLSLQLLGELLVERQGGVRVQHVLKFPSIS
jgi:hypothetical protein